MTLGPRDRHRGGPQKDFTRGTGDGGNCKKDGTRHCPVCGRAFKPTTANARYCPPTEADRERQARSRCARRALNHAHRSREGIATIPLAAPLPEPFKCAECAKACVPGQNVAPHATKFCCPSHKAAWHKRQEKEKTDATH